MANATQAGIASFFGGLARGISQRALQRDQQKQAEKDARTKLLGEIVTAGIQSGNIKNPSEAMAYLMKETGFKDPETMAKVKNVMEQATTIVPRFMDRGQSPGTPIGLQTPGGGPSEAPATGPQPSPGRSVALKEPVREPGPPQFYSADEMEAKSREHESYLEDLKTKHDVAVAKVRADTSADNRVASRRIATRGQLGLEGDPNERMQVTTFDSGREQIGPVEARPEKVDNSPEGRLAKAYEDSGMDPVAAKKKAATQILAIASANMTKALLGNQTATERLKQLRALGPLHEQLARDHADALEWSTREKQAIAAGDPKTILDKYRAAAAAIIKDKGGDPTDVETQLLKEAGFDRDELEKQLHPPSATAQEIADLVNKGGEGAPGATKPTPPPANFTIKWASTDAKVKANILRDHPKAGPGIYTDPETKKTVTINRDGTVVVK